METKRIKTVPLALFALVIPIVMGCSEKKKGDDVIAPKVVKKVPSAPIAMQVYEQKKTVNVSGNALTITIIRQPDDSLSMVSDETGQKFVDNHISLTLTNQQGKTIVSKVFRKSNFSSYLDDDYRETGILEGLVFDRVEGNTIKLAASVSHPQTDEYIPLVVKLSLSGSISISRDTKLDTSSEEED